MSGKLLDIDKGWKKLKQALTSVANRHAYVKVGVMGNAGSETVAIAAINEFGAPKANIPSRPFIGGTYDLNKEKYVKQMVKGLDKVFRNEMSVETLLGRIGASIAGDIKKTVTSTGSFVRNAQRTIDKKGSDVPLVDTGRLLNAVSWEVVTGPEEK